MLVLFVLLHLMACQPDSASSGNSGSDTESTATDTEPTDTATDSGNAVTLVFAGLTRIVDAVGASDGVVYASGEGAAGPGVYRWDGALTRVRAVSTPAALVAGTDDQVYAIDGSDILRVSDGAVVEGPGPYSPSALDLMPTGQGDRLTFGGSEPRGGAIGAYTVKAAGGAVALVGEGYAAAPRWLYRPGAETVWTLHADGHLWLVPSDSDTAVDVGGGFPVGGLGGNADGTVLFLGDGAALATYDTVAAALSAYPLDLPDGSVLSVHAEPGGATLVLGVQSSDGAAVYRTATP